MSADDFYTPTEGDSLRLENELLAFEVRFLKARAAETERLEDRVKELEDLLEKSRNSAAYLETAEQDLIALLRSLSNGRLGWYLGLKRDFRTLERRYLDTDA